MYPASHFAITSARTPVAARSLTAAATMILLLAVLGIFVALRPDPPFMEQGGVPTYSCVERFGGRQDPCRLVVPDRRIPQRIAFGLSAVMIAGGLLVAAGRREARHCVVV